MGHDKVGPKQQQLQEMRARRFAENAKKPSVAELRGKVAKAKPVKKGARRRG